MFPCDCDAIQDAVSLEGEHPKSALHFHLFDTCCVLSLQLLYRSLENGKAVEFHTGFLIVISSHRSLLWSVVRKSLSSYRHRSPGYSQVPSDLVVDSFVPNQAEPGGVSRVALNPATTVDLDKMEGNGQAFPLDMSSFDLRNFSGNVDVGNMFNPGNTVSGDQQGSHPQQRQQQQLASGGQQSQPQDSRNAPFFGQFGAPTAGGIGVDDFQLLLNMGPNTQNAHPSLAITTEQLKEQLAQQLKLQQLQQLQNRILQEQVSYPAFGSVPERL
jgi:hypothetical protein